MAGRVTRSGASMGKQDANSSDLRPSTKLSKTRISAARKNESTRNDRPSPNSSRKRKHVSVKKEEDSLEDEAEGEPLMSGALKSEPDDQIEPKNEQQDEPSEPPAKRRSNKNTKQLPDSDIKAGSNMANAAIANRDSQYTEPSPSKAARAKNNSYGLSPGVSPFPTFNAPTPQQCQEVNDILSKAHGAVSAPKSIPQPSLNSSGCGEVPSVLDALVRTRLSAATNGNNSSRAFRGLVEKFGIIKEGVGKGSVNWENVRQAPVKEVFEAIKAGGLADVKSKDIQAILNMVKEENEADRQKAAGDEEGDTAKEAREREVAKSAAGVLSLDHLHTMKDREAMDHLLRYPGIGPKTASCVLLFCMQRPSFAVDTHVFRLTRWLGWVPTDAQAKGMWKRGECKSRVVGRESTYAHLETKIPDELKYPLHYLLIKHGKTCGWCSAKAGKDQKKGTCPLAHLMSGKGRSKGLASKSGNDVDEEMESDDGEEEDEQPEDFHGAELFEEKN